MKTLKNNITSIIQFFQGLNNKTKENTAGLNNNEYTNNQFGINFKQDLTATKTPKSLFYQMYAVENEMLFI